MTRRGNHTHESKVKDGRRVSDMVMVEGGISMARKERTKEEEL